MISFFHAPCILNYGYDGWSSRSHFGPSKQEPQPRGGKEEMRNQSGSLTVLWKCHITPELPSFEFLYVIEKNCYLVYATLLFSYKKSNLNLYIFKLFFRRNSPIILAENKSLVYMICSCPINSVFSNCTYWGSQHGF